jgi:peptidoglycan/xylan/chitin deacetylase (PgdA/CDA1 family)
MVMARFFRTFLIIQLIVMISGCSEMVYIATPSIVPAETITLTPVPPTPIPPTGTPFPSPTSTATPTTVLIFQSGTITCPILLYHRIAEPLSSNSINARYYTTPADFEWQMQALKDWGYATIPMSLFVDTITMGAVLPPRPIVISFDDGDESVFEIAYPIMQKFGYTGILYLVGNYVGAQGYMDTSQINEMTSNGWEIGSHSMSHPHLPADHDQIYFEAGHSIRFLSSEIGVDVEGIDTFAYPFGEIDSFVVTKIAEYGYSAAVGLGTQYAHNLDTLYYLSRIEVRNGTDLAAFAALLPWSGRP